MSGALAWAPRPQASPAPPARVRSPLPGPGWRIPLAPGGKRSREDAPLAGKGSGAGFTFGAVSVLPPGPPLLQASLRVGRPDTPLEREAEEIAGRVVGPGMAPVSLAAPAAVARSVSGAQGRRGYRGSSGIRT